MNDKLKPFDQWYQDSFPAVPQTRQELYELLHTTFAVGAITDRNLVLPSDIDEYVARPMNDAESKAADNNESPLGNATIFCTGRVVQLIFDSEAEAVACWKYLVPVSDPEQTIDDWK